MPYPRKIRPWRGGPNWNMVHGMRVRINQATPNAGRGELAFTGLGAANAIPIGTLPAGAVITGVYRNVETAFTVGTTLDLGVAAGDATLAASAAIAPQTVARGDVAMGAGANMPTADTTIWLTAGATMPTDGVIDILVQFYINKD